MIGLAAASHLLRSFRLRDFRLIWASDSVIGGAEQMEFVVLGWFLLVETDSPFLVGVFAALRFTGTLFSPLYGILVDRYDRVTLLTFVRVGFGLRALVILLLSVSGELAVWHVFILVAMGGMGRPFDNITREALVADIVARPQLSNAVALTRTGRDMTQVAGPVVGGFLLSRVGMSWVYTVVGSLYFVAAFLASRLRPPRRTPSGTKASVLGGLLETVQYIRMHQLILALLLVAFLVNLTGFPLIFGLMPVFARNVLGTDPTGLGRLMGAYAIGATLGSITIAALVRMGRPGRVVLAGSLGWHGAILVVSRMRLFMPSIAVLAVAGVAQSFTMVTLAILLLSSTDTAVRGRIMGVRALAVYGLPMGLVISAAMADLISTPTALVVDATVGIALTLAIAVSLRSLWRHA